MRIRIEIRRSVRLERRAVDADVREILLKPLVGVVHFPTHGVDIRKDVKSGVFEFLDSFDKFFARGQKVRIIDIKRYLVPVIDLIPDRNAKTLLQLNRRVDPIPLRILFGGGAKRPRSRVSLFSELGI